MEYQIQQDLLAKFSWLEDEIQPSRSISIKDFFEESFRDEHLTWMTEHCGSPTKGHAASITTKRIGYLAAIYVYAKSVHHAKSSFMEGIMHTKEVGIMNNGWNPLYSFPLTPSSNDVALVKWVATDLYAKHLVPLVSLLGKEKGISQTTLFENIFTYMKWVFTIQIGNKELYQQLLTWPTSDFGNVSRHPIAFYDRGDDALRKTCCLFYQTTGDNEPCKTCPLI